MDKFSSWIILSVTFVFISNAYGGEFCGTSGGAFLYCNYGCCGYLHQECCSPSVGLIVGLTVVGVLVLSVIIAVVCCIRRRRGIIGRVISTNPGTTTVVQSAQTTMTTGQPGVFYPPQTYGAAVCGPPPYATDGCPQPYQQPVQPYPPGQSYPPAQPYPLAQPYPPPVQSYPSSGPPYPMPVGQLPNPPPYEEVGQYQAYKQ